LPNIRRSSAEQYDTGTVDDANHQRRPGRPGRTRPNAPPSDSEDRANRRVLVDSISSGRVPLKFAYAGSAAFTHDTYASTANYAEMMTSAALETDALLATGRCGPGLRQLAEVGPGNGEHSTELLKCLRDRGIGIQRYLGLDFSATLLQISCARLLERGPGDLAVDTGVWDVESRPTGVVERWRTGAGPVLACLVGNTLGNFEDPAGALRNLARVLRPDDLLLASVLLAPGRDSIGPSMRAYRTAEFRRAALEPMIVAGMNPNELEFTVDYCDGAFIGEVTLLSRSRLDDKDLPAGYRFRCFMSRRFERDQVVEIFRQAGWLPDVTAIDEDSNHMTVVASPAEEKN
jgi:L-histidine N-alpha-methyltransferase